MTDQPKPAPTAEEQSLELPPLDENIVKSVDELSRHMKVQLADIVAVRYMVANNVLCGLDEREAQLLAALRSNREKDAQYQTLNDVVIAKCTQVKELVVELAEKDAKIAELTRALGDEHRADIIINEIVKKYMADAEAAEAKLRAVSEAMNEPYDTNAPWAKVARIRAIVEGKGT